jgi:hypothetical protein
MPYMSVGKGQTNSYWVVFLRGCPTNHYAPSWFHTILKMVEPTL